MSIKSYVFAALSAVVLGFASGSWMEAQAGMGKKFGAPTEGMSAEEYQSLVFLDPQNTVRMDWDAVRGMDGYFMIDNQGEPTISVVDYNEGKTTKKINLGDIAGNHHLGVIPGARNVW